MGTQSYLDLGKHVDRARDNGRCEVGTAGFLLAVAGGKKDEARNRDVNEASHGVLHIDKR